MPTAAARLLLFFFLLPVALAAIELQLSNIALSFNPTLYDQFSCNGVDLNLVVQVTTSNNTQQNTYRLVQANAKDDSYLLQNNTIFTINSNTDFISVTAVLVIDCSLISSYSDTFLIFTQDKTSPDFNNRLIDINVDSTRNKNQWYLQAKFTRYCPRLYGFNCDKLCTPIDDGLYCYYCGEQGAQTCCQKQDVNQDTCMYYGTGGTTPAPVLLAPDCTAETVYMWLMITFIIISFILFLILLFLAFLLTKKNKKIEDDDGESDNGFRDERPIKQHSYSYSKAVSKKKDPNRTAYYVGKDTTQDNRAYDQNSFTEEWIEPMPRRTARV